MWIRNLALERVEAVSQLLDVTFARASFHWLSAELTSRTCALAAGTGFGSVLARGITPNLFPAAFIACA